MEIKKSGTQQGNKGPADWFTGSVRIDPLFEPPEPACVRGASVTFEPGARTAWHTHPLGPGYDDSFDNQPRSPLCVFAAGACSAFAGIGRSGCAASESVAAALTAAPLERIACSIFFSLMASGS
jgi:hypothetical protein